MLDIGGEKSEKWVLLRADGSHTIGVGHVMRCLAFAQALKTKNLRSLFVMKGYDRKISDLITSYGFDVEIIPPEVSFDEDASRTVKIANKTNIRLIVTDMSNSKTMAEPKLYGQYLKALKAQGIFLVTIDGLDTTCISDKMVVSSDIVVIPYFGAEAKNYKFSKSTKPLLGPSYFIFRQELIEAAKDNSAANKKNVKNILITMGGSDPLNLTAKITKALNRIGKDDLDIKVAVGVAFSPAAVKELKSIAKNNTLGKYEFAINSTSAVDNINMVKLLIWSDIVFSSGGLTKYETAFLGKPTIIISQNKDEEDGSNNFVREMDAIHLGLGVDLGENKIATALERILEDDALRIRMAARGKSRLDGKGSERIISEIPQEIFV
jgi:UDP-2,4-diacetamido-2,4,6-trideoxy-beta-L-altropyranose hydrolase